MSELLDPRQAPLPKDSALLRKDARATLSGAIITMVLALAALLGPMIYLGLAAQSHRTDFEQLSATATAQGSKGASVEVEVSNNTTDTVLVSKDVNQGETFPVWRKGETGELFDKAPRIDWFEWLICAAIMLVGTLMVIGSVKLMQQRTLMLRASPDTIRGVLRAGVEAVGDIANGDSKRRAMMLRVLASSMPNHPVGHQIALTFNPVLAPPTQELAGELEGWVLSDDDDAKVLFRAPHSSQWWTGDRTKPQQVHQIMPRH